MKNELITAKKHVDPGFAYGVWYEPLPGYFFQTQADWEIYQRGVVERGYNRPTIQKNNDNA